MKLRGNYAGGHETLFVERLEQMTDQCRLPGADFPGNNDETLALALAVGEMRQRGSVNGTLEEETMIRRQLEWRGRETVEIFVHADRQQRVDQNVLRNVKNATFSLYAPENSLEKNCGPDMSR